MKGLQSERDGPAPGVVIVTGGSRGIGAAIARLAAARGYTVCINYLSDHEAANGVVEDIRR